MTTFLAAGAGLADEAGQEAPRVLAPSQHQVLADWIARRLSPLAPGDLAGVLRVALVDLEGRPCSSATSRRPADHRARLALAALFSSGVPEPTAMKNKELERRVGWWLKNSGLVPVSFATVMRAAGRRR